MLNRASVRIVRDVREWLSGRTNHDGGDEDWLPDGDAVCCLELLLQAREDWLDSPDPTLWKTGDAHRLLIDTAAPRLTDIYRLAEFGSMVLRALVDFLDDTDRFHPASMRVATLRKELDRATAKFPAAMSDKSVWRLAKRIFNAMRVDGVDINDDDAVDAWAAQFSTAAPDRRDVVLGGLLDRQPELLTAQFVIRDGQVAAIAPGAPVPPQLRRHDPDTCPDCPAVPANPPISLPPADELADAARKSALLHQMLAAGRWAGTGRKVTRLGLPRPADIRSLAAAVGIEVGDDVRDVRDHVGLIRAWRLALDAEALRLHTTVVVAGPVLPVLEQAVAVDTDPGHTLRVWKDITDIAVAGPARLTSEDNRIARLDEFSQPWGPRALGELYRIDGPIQLDDLVEGLVTDYHGAHADELLAVMIGAAVRSGLLAGTQAGCVRVTVPDYADTLPDAELDQWVRRSGALTDEPPWAVTPVPGTRVELTPLGRYLVRLNLLAEGSHAPVLESASG
jgi:hypothetical protein